MQAILMNLFLTTLVVGGVCGVFTLFWLLNESDLAETIVRISYIATMISILAFAIVFLISIWICEW